MKKQTALYRVSDTMNLLPLLPPPSPLFRATPLYTSKYLRKVISFFSYIKEVLYLRWNERHLRAYFETLIIILQETLMIVLQN